MPSLNKSALFNRSPRGRGTQIPGGRHEGPGGRRPSALGYHLAIILILKVALLAVLWKCFIAPNRVPVNETVMGAHITASNHTYQENSRDRFDGR